ncbi:MULTISPECIES: SDR family NAD(P)-dependent oxidoreductase [Caproicibacterium]|jgi:hypothetical protein|uniref:SDR family NAD(P)-dependent oxidoreductase n=1 Tax=Caproicibacterium lactatifermentans TaxID=2666138 RepID=A0A859DPR1_9FIRM|nr:SDR family oxidoreductase [Caproicibacterium lactatifermentans]ARP50836.1 hypothetical protein B6259_08140 [Ruminococcaceae bacterium CPB6]MDD4807722.1 SDR family oxidoreductase [Oscillospiraceae bacterium]QKN23435.1 SDR family NAD(P)-dependent oxidoreductase [Caproicibacterium lactatifermentans]QKO29886.1 SDR family NAD(P)-dependent oxidoreductase [Caproicibacterium lactatifermentans]
MRRELGPKQTVLITGASSGIGRELAILFAAHGFRLVLTARTQSRLEQLAQLLRQTFHVTVEVLPADLSKAEAAQQVYDTLQEKGIVVDQLVSNAGSARHQEVIEADIQGMADTIALNVTSTTLLTRLFAADMVWRGRGRILITASTSAFAPDPCFAVYSATKAYDLQFGETLWAELRYTPVSVSVLCPGPTKTGFSAAAGRQDASFAANPRRVALAAFRGMQAGKLLIFSPPLYGPACFLSRLLPPQAAAVIPSLYQQVLSHHTKDIFKNKDSQKD